VMTDGGMTERMLIRAEKLHPANALTPEQCALVETLAIGCHAVNRGAPVKGEHVLVVGAGPIGLMATAVVRHAGARYVVVSEPNPFRRELAMKMGATLVVDPRERSLQEAQAELGMVEGFDVVLEMSGNAAAMRDAMANMAHGAGMAILGIPTADVQIDFNHVIFKMLTLRGIYGREMFETWYKMSVMLQSGLDIRPAITHRFSFREHEAAFAAARSGDSGKVIMDWGGEAS